jgi:pimeloyl-ACP methyl ester carboxylesterase
MQVTSVSPGIEPIPVQTTISAGYVNPPQQLTDTTFFGLNSNPPSVGDYNRVIALLRSAAQEKNANTILQTVALNYASNYQLPPYSQTPQIVLTAMTQLAVTGSAAFAAWNGNSDMQSFLEDQGVDASTAATYSTQITNDFNTALQLIRSPNSRYTPQQDKGNTVPWVAVSGEDDSPDNPVNVQMSPFPQFHLTISVNNSLGQAISLNIRYLLASNNIPNTTTVPFIPPGDEVILFIHGEGSRAEEAGNLIPPLLSIGSSVNRSFTVISLDLPSNGYSTMVPHTSVAGVPSDTTQFLGVNLGETLTAFPLLDFTQSAITTFVEQLLSTLAFSNPIVAVVGGSLGGHMALRLLASQPAWLKRVVAWSPASVEDHSTLSIPSLPLSMFTNPVLSSSNPNSSMSMSAPELSGGAQNNDSRFQFFQNVFVNDTFFGVIIQWTTVFAAVALVYPALVAAGSLFGLLFVAFLVANIFSAFQTEPPQATMWYWDNWPGKPNAINQDILDRCEIYNETFRQWHWRICEELISFDFSVLSGSFVNPLLLLVGEEDNFVDAHFLDNVKALASNLGSPGYCFTVQQTGHSIHDEHPTFLAQKIIDFTAPPFAGSPLPPPVGVQFVPGTLAVITNGDGRLEVFAVNQNDGNIWHAWQLQPGGSWQTWVPLPASLPLVDGELVSFAAIPSLYGPLQSPAVVLRNGALEIFAISSAGAPYRISQDAIGAVGGWGQWNAMVSPPGQIWSISAGVSSNIPVVVYSTDQGVFYDYSIIMSLTGGLIEGWVGPQAGP